jgi:hypothetical protein
MKSRKSMRSTPSQNERDDIELEKTSSAEVSFGSSAEAAIDPLRADEPVHHEL